MKNTFVKGQRICILEYEAVHFGTGVHMYQNTGSNNPGQQNFDIILSNSVVDIYSPWSFFFLSSPVQTHYNFFFF